METGTIEEILDTIIESALRSHASDIHIDPTKNFLVITFRIDGALQFQKNLDLILHEGIMLRIKVLARLRIDDIRRPKDGKFSWRNKDATLTAEVRVSMMPTLYGENAVLRIFDPLISIFSLRDLGFSELHTSSLEKALSLQSGLILIVGPTGSGKTTTLYSILSYLKNSSRQIVTVEDPIERPIEGIRQIEVDGNGLLDCVTILRSILRQDPDIIMIGEIRDKQNAELAIESALTGHLVISTLHASSCYEVKNRLVNMGIPEYLIDATLRCALSQRLVCKICTNCIYDDPDFHSSHTFKKGKGCLSCNETGVNGRMVVSEIYDGNYDKNISPPTPLYMDAFQKAGCGLIPFSEVIQLNQEYVSK